jgi:hypothetical protein
MLTFYRSIKFKLKRDAEIQPRPLRYNRSLRAFGLLPERHNRAQEYL